MESTLPGRPWRWSPGRLGFTLAISLALAIYAAQLSGHWHSAVSTQQARHLFGRIDSPHMSPEFPEIVTMRCR